MDWFYHACLNAIRKEGKLADINKSIGEMAFDLSSETLERLKDRASSCGIEDPFSDNFSHNLNTWFNAQDKVTMNEDMAEYLVSRRLFHIMAECSSHSGGRITLIDWIVRNSGKAHEYLERFPVKHMNENPEDMITNPLAYYARKLDKRAVNILVGRGVDVNAKSGIYKAPAAWYASLGILDTPEEYRLRNEIVSILKNNGADMSLKARDGRSAQQVYDNFKKLI